MGIGEAHGLSCPERYNLCIRKGTTFVPLAKGTPLKVRVYYCVSFSKECEN